MSDVAARTRPPKRLLLAFLGEHVVDRGPEPIRASVIIEVLAGVGIAEPATRATLDRMARRGLLERSRNGREIAFVVTETAAAVIREAGSRVHSPTPFAPQGDGWTLVTFSLPERERALRHRLRATLGWEGFAPLRDGLWLAPGVVDLDATLAPLQHDLPDGTVTAFRASEVGGFGLATQVADAWDVATIRTAHDEFLAEWNAARAGGSALSVSTALVSDWLELLRADPRLPARFLGDGWPAGESVRVFAARYRELRAEAESEFAELVRR